MPKALFIGIDLGTSGIRACCIDERGEEQHSATHNYEHETDTSSTKHWQDISFSLIQQITQQVDSSKIKALAVDGTSSTVLLCDLNGTPVSPVLMYNDNRCRKQAKHIKGIAPKQTAAHGTSSSLAKCLYLLEKAQDIDNIHLCHQADWLTGCFTGIYSLSDENNSLKLGYDAENRSWPEWLAQLELPKALLPEVKKPGEIIGQLLPNIATELKLPSDCQVISGTTDSIAALIATGASQPGDAVTSLGSTLVIKIVTERPIYEPSHGIYSHRLGDLWLAGGASNSGGSVLLKYFDQQQLDAMSPKLKPDSPIGLNYYPLPDTGERFPRNNASLQSNVSPRPENDIEFFQALLEGIADIEAESYEKLIQLGATKPTHILTTGGGSKNQHWNKIRQNKLGITVSTAENTEASYGAALLAKQAFE